MNEHINKILVAVVSSIVSAVLGGAAVYVAKAIRVEPRLEAIERTLTRIENHLYQAPAQRTDRQ